MLTKGGADAVMEIPGFEFRHGLVVAGKPGVELLLSRLARAPVDLP